MHTALRAMCTQNDHPRTINVKSHTRHQSCEEADVLYSADVRTTTESETEFLKNSHRWVGTWSRSSRIPQPKVKVVRRGLADPDVAGIGASTNPANYRNSRSHKYLDSVATSVRKFASALVTRNPRTRVGWNG